ncbi:MAG TPA: SpoIIE family protein phosphatase [Solirubrobacteraceae bacterium]|nr:SpoIIE family protein phosphatase [Solirubrobacteraceae bacterium]
MSTESELLEDRAEELFEEAPCGYVSTRVDGTIVQVNRTFEAWTGHERGDVLGRVRFQDLLSPGGRIYYETHYAPLLQMQGSVREIAAEIVRADGSSLPVLINSVLRRDEAERPRVIRTTIFDATDRRRYEQELLRSRRREHATAEQLQRSLLSGSLPETPGLAIDVFYRAAVKGTEVGGDWYDAFWLEDGLTVGLVVGDVVGRGITAAAAMGQLRSAVRAFAGTGLGPAGVLAALDRYSRRHQVGKMATVVFAQLEVTTGSLCFACAGHPPPIVGNPGEAPDFVWEGRSTPINAYPDCAPRAESCLSLGRGGTFLMYTDGLTEHRHRTDDGLARLLETVAAGLDLPFAGFTGQVAQALRDPSEADDVCLLATRLS